MQFGFCILYFLFDLAKDAKILGANEQAIIKQRKKIKK